MNISISKKLSISLLLAAGMAVAHADVLTWDPSLSGGSGGAGTWDYNGTANWWNGGSDVKWLDNSLYGTNSAIFGGSAGAVTLNSSLSASNLQFTVSGYTISGSGTLTLGAGGINAGGSATISNPVSLAPGQQPWQVTSGPLAVNGVVSRSAGATVDFSSSGVTSTSLANDASGILGGWATVGNYASSASTGDWAANDGSGNIITYTGYTLVSGSTSGSGASAQNWENSAAGTLVTLTASATINSLTQQGDFSVPNGSTLTIASGGMLFKGTSRWFLDNGGGNLGTAVLNSGLASGELFIHSPNNDTSVNPYDWRIWPQIQNNGATPGIVVKDGPGMMSLQNTNSYSGGTIINNGFLVPGKDEANTIVSHTLGTGTVTVNNPGILEVGFGTPNAGLDYYCTNSIVVSGGKVLADDGHQHLSGPISVLAAGATFGSTYDGGTKALYIEGVLSGSGPVALQQAMSAGAADRYGNGSGNAYNNSVVVFTNNANTYSGTITLVPYNTGGGSYVGINASASLQNATLNLANNTGTAHRFAGSGSIYSSLIFNTGLGSATIGALTGSGDIILNGYNESTYALGSDAIALTVGNNNASTSFSGSIIGSGSLTKNGNGTLTLSGTTTYSGDTTIGGGTLALTSGFVSSTNITVARGTTLDISGLGTVSFAASQNLYNGGTVNGSVTTGSGSKVYAGTDGGYGTNAITGNLTLTSGTAVYVDVGTLAVGSNDLISVAGTLTANNNIIHVKAPSVSSSLQAADYTLITSPNTISGSFAGAPSWDVAPVNAGNFSLVTSGGTVKLHYAAFTAPTGGGSATPSAAYRNQKVLISVTATNGTGGAVNSVVVDASSIGGSSSLALVSAGGNVWTNTVTVTPDTSAGGKTLIATLTDTASLHGLVNISLTVIVNNDVWNGAATDNNFSSNLNWTNQLAPGYVGDSLEFAGTTRLSPNMDNNYTATGITFDSGAGSFNIGTANSSTLTLAGGIINNSANAQTLSVPMALSGTAVVNPAAGNINVSGVLSGSGSLTKTGNGTLALNASGNSVSGSLTVSGGTVNVSGGTTAFGTSLSRVGYLTNSGTMTVTGGSFTSGGDVWVGGSDQNGTAYNAVGALTVSGGSTVSVGGALLAARGNNNQNTVSGTVTVNSGVLNVESDILLGFAGNQNLGKLVVNSGGTVNLATTTKRWLLMSQWDTSQSEVDINGGQLNINAGTDIRYSTGNNSGTNTFNLNSGAVTFYSDNGTIIGGGVVDLHQGNGAACVNTFNLNGGTLTVMGITSANTAGSRTFNFNGGTLKATIDNSSFINLGSGSAVANVRNGGAIIDDGGYGLTIPQPLLHSTIVGDSPADGGLTKLGSGVIGLAATNTYTGATMVMAGVLGLSTNLSVAGGAITGSTNIYTAAGAIFDVHTVPTFTLGGNQAISGSGTVNGSVNTSAGSKVYAGTDGTYGTLTFNNDLTLASGALCYMDVGTTFNGVNDSIALSGNLIANGNVIHIKAPSTSVSLDTSDYTLITASFISGTFATAPVWDVAPANAGHYTIVTSGNTVTLHYNAAAAAPTVAASATPSTVLRNQPTRIVATVTPGTASISSVTLDLSTLGGSTISLVQSNASNVYTNTVTVPAATAAGSVILTVTATDTASQTGSASVNLTVVTSTEVWNGGGGNQNWSTNPNWVSGSAPGYVGDTLAFAGSAGLTPNMDTNYSATGLTFSNNASSFNIGTANNSTLTLTANGILNLSANAQTVNVPVVLSASETINASAGNITLGQTVDNGGNSLTVSGSGNTAMNGVVAGAGGLTKNGNGTLALSANNTFSGATVINGGTVNLTGSVTNTALDVVGAAAGNAVLNISGNLIEAYTPANIWESSFNIGSVSGASSDVRMTSGTFTVPKQLAVGTGNSGAYAAFSQSGGTTFIGGFLAVGGSSVGGVFNQSGGSVTMNGASVTIGYATTAAQAVMNLSGNAVFNISGTGNGLWPGEVGTGVLTVSGNAQLTIANDGIVLGKGNASGSGTANLLGGVTTVNSVSRGTGAGVLNFNGGTLSANAASSTFVSGLTAAYIYSGGAVIDDGGNAVTITQPLLAPAGYGVVSIPVTSGGSGYIDTPIVVVTNITATGSGATAVANVSGGAITSITVTCPGQGYGAGDTLGVSILGGGGSGAVIGTPVLGQVSSGGLTKNGAGTLTLSGANTYTGNTTVNAGTLSLAQAALATNSTVTIASGAVMNLTFSTTNQVGSLILNGVTQSGGVYNSTTAPTYFTGTGSLLVASTTASNPTNITFSVSGSTMSLSWPADHLGWILQAQTNNLSTGLGTNWVDVPGSSSSTNATITVNPSAPSVFYRLRHP